MISIQDRKIFARAEEKARLVRPHVSMVQLGQYQVTNDKGVIYTVKFSRDNEHWQAECNCLAHTSGTPKPCYHIPSAYSAHRIQVNIRKSIRAFDHSCLFG